MIRTLIFAGGTGQRMNSRSKPKQFLEVHGKPIIIYTIEHFEYHPEVDDIVVVCIKEWIEELQGILKRYGITKVSLIVPGGETGHDSIYFGLEAMYKTSKPDDIILIHDGVRPLVTEELITKNIQTTRECGNAITSESVRESVVRSGDKISIESMPPRDEVYIAKAPQTFRYAEIYEVYVRARKDGIKTVDSAYLCNLYGVKMSLVESTPNNLKITAPADYYIFRALYEAIEGQQIYGL